VKYGAVPLLVFNLKRGAWPAAAAAAAAGGGRSAASPEDRLVAALRASLDPAGEVAWTAIDLQGGNSGGVNFTGEVATRVAAFVQEGVAASKGKNSARSLPDWSLTPDSAVFLNIPVSLLGWQWPNLPRSINGFYVLNLPLFPC
jgi:hypothetical protein